MWCEHCQTDVATVVSEDGQSLLCTTCGQPAKKIVAPSLHPETKSAREFLERWAREQQALKQQRAAETSAGKDSTGLPEVPAVPATPLSKFPLTPKNEPVAKNDLPAVEPVSNPKGQSHRDASSEDAPVPRKTRWRLDTEHPAPTGSLPGRQDHPKRSQRLEKVLGTANEVPANDQTPQPEPKAVAPPEPVVNEHRKKLRKVRLDVSHQEHNGPYFDPRVNVPRKNSLPGRLETLWGQLMAYLGVGLLTVGTVFVLWGYFGDIERFASTGWLIATAGQMLLLLGIVTLVGGGMQQTTHEVSQRIENLGGRIIRIEQSTDKILMGPRYRRSGKRAGGSAGSGKEAA